MDPKMMFKQMLDFQKATFDNSFKAMSTIQEQGEKMVDRFIETATWMPEEGKNAVQNWMNAYKKGREEFITTVEKNYDKVQEYFSGSNKEA
jgi:polyhydroxyalkanoate synthesis regulator phasin